MNGDDLGGFGERLTAARVRLDMNQAQLAELVATDTGTVSRWERGKGYPQAQQLARLALVLGESLDHLVLGTAGNHAPRIMPPAFIDFLQTEYGRIAQSRGWLPTLLAVQTTNAPTVRFYQAIVAGLMMDDDA